MKIPLPKCGKPPQSRNGGSVSVLVEMSPAGFNELR